MSLENKSLRITIYSMATHDYLLFTTIIGYILKTIFSIWLCL
jgi:hypothetical protein